MLKVFKVSMNDCIIDHLPFLFKNHILLFLIILSSLLIIINLTFLCFLIYLISFKNRFHSLDFNHIDVRALIKLKFHTPFHFYFKLSIPSTFIFYLLSRPRTNLSISSFQRPDVSNLNQQNEVFEEKRMGWSNQVESLQSSPIKKSNRSIKSF